MVQAQDQRQKAGEWGPDAEHRTPMCTPDTVSQNTTAEFGWGLGSFGPLLPRLAICNALIKHTFVGFQSPN